VDGYRSATMIPTTKPMMEMMTAQVAPVDESAQGRGDAEGDVKGGVDRLGPDQHGEFDRRVHL
jgi:hypothetical protein